ncbi:MAG: hypothetical protein ACK5AZ_25040 [Bryobacteraceae bacterium]
MLAHPGAPASALAGSAMISRQSSTTPPTPCVLPSGDLSLETAMKGVDMAPYFHVKRDQQTLGRNPEFDGYVQQLNRRPITATGECSFQEISSGSACLVT